MFGKAKKPNDNKYVGVGSNKPQVSGGLPGKPSLKKGKSSRSPVDNSVKKMIDDVKSAGGSGDPYPLD